MIEWLKHETTTRVPLHVRQKAWQALKPSGNKYQDLVNWYMKWSARLKDLEVTDLQVLDQFDLCVRGQFGPAVSEMLKKEQEMKAKDPTLRMTLEQGYEFIRQAVSDNVRALMSYGDTNTPNMFPVKEYRVLSEKPKLMDQNPPGVLNLELVPLGEICL